MKLFTITAKNLRLLFRSKISIIVLILAPLLIMLFIGVAFNNPVASKMNIGFYAKEKTNLTNSFILALQDNKNFVVQESNSEVECTARIQEGKSHLCIIFPEEFIIQNNKSNNIIFYVDQSRANFVYVVIDTVSQRIDLTSTQLSYQMTNDLINVIQHQKERNNNNIMSLIKLKTAINEVSANLDSVKSNLNKMDLDKKDIKTTSMASSLTTIQSDVDKLKTDALLVVSTGKDLVDDIETYVDSSNGTTMLDTFDKNLTAYATTIKSDSNKTTVDITALKSLIDTANEDIAALNKKLEDAKTARSESAEKITQAQSALAQVKTDLDNLKASIETINAEINALKITSAESIVNPITTEIRPVSTKSNNLNFIFPYFIVLLIMFICIMLSSTLIIMEKTSKAYFRNFTTPTGNFTFIISTFLTTFIVVVVQMTLILALAYYFLNASILTNIGLTLGVLIAAIILFTFIGMIIGYMFNSQESVMIAAISVSSVMLFLSNLILPLETVSVYLQEIARIYNPYVICSELLKKITLFNMQWNTLQIELLMLGTYVATAFILTIIIQKISKMQYIHRRPLAKIAKADENIEKYLQLKNGNLIKTEEELMKELQSMTDDVFKDYVDEKKNDFEAWLIMNKKPVLAKKIGNCKTREEIIKILEARSESKEPKEKESKKK